MKRILFGLTLLASMSAFAGTITVHTHNEFRPLGVEFGFFGVKDLKGGSLEIHGPDEIISGNDFVVREHKLKDLYFKYLIGEPQSSSVELQSIVTKSLKNDFISQQRALEIYIDGLNSCLSKVEAYEDVVFSSQFRCTGESSEDLNKALEIVKAIASNASTSYMNYSESRGFDSFSDSSFSVPGLGAVDYFEEEETFILENHIFPKTHSFKLTKIICSPKQCLLVVNDDTAADSESRMIYESNHPTTGLLR